MAKEVVTAMAHESMAHESVAHESVAHESVAQRGAQSGGEETGQTKSATGVAQEGRRRPIVPQGFPCSIVGAGGLNDRVRDGNGWTPSAIVTNPPAPPGALRLR